MATLDGMPLFDSSGRPTSGGAFLLNGAPEVCLVGSGTDGWNVEVKAGGRYVVARNPKTLSGYQESREAAFKAAQQGLDLFSISRSADLGIRDSETEHITWWPEFSGQVLRTTNVMTLSATLNAKVMVRDAAGNARPDPPTPPVTWHSSLRYFRLAQVTDDLFDAYRNLYLALEAILDRIAPQAVNVAGKPEGEGVWFKRALGVADTRVPLAPHAPKGSTDPVQDLYDELYLKTRTALFHAKSSRTSILPHAPGKEQEAVAAAMSRLCRLYIALAEKELGTRSTMGMFYAAGFDMMTNHLIGKLRLQTTDDTAAADPDNEVLNPTGGAVIDLETRHAPELEKPLIRSFLGSAKVDELRKLSRLSVVAAKLNEQLIACGSVEGVLILSGVERLESQVSIRLRNPQQPKAYFAS